MKELMAAIWQKMTEVRHTQQAIEADYAKLEKLMNEARAEASTLEAKSEALERLNKELAEKSQLSNELEKKNDAIQAKLAKIKESI